jgi:hypothetical protein
MVLAVIPASSCEERSIDPSLNLMIDGGTPIELRVSPDGNQLAFRMVVGAWPGIQPLDFRTGERAQVRIQLVRRDDNTGPGASGSPRPAWG